MLWISSLSLPEERGVDPSSRDNEAIRVASKNGHTDVVKLLLSLPKIMGVEPFVNDNYLIECAARFGHV